MQLVQAAQYLDAARAFERAAQQSPTLADAHAMRADALMRAGTFEPALASVERALRLRPGWPEALMLRGNIEGLLGRHREAEATLTSPWFPGFVVYRQEPDRWWDRAFIKLGKDLRLLRPRSGSGAPESPTGL